MSAANPPRMAVLAAVDARRLVNKGAEGTRLRRAAAACPFRSMLVLSPHPPVLAAANIIKVFLDCDLVGQIITVGLAVFSLVAAGAVVFPMRDAGADTGAPRMMATHHEQAVRMSRTLRLRPRRSRPRGTYRCR